MDLWKVYDSPKIINKNYKEMDETPFQQWHNFTKHEAEKHNLPPLYKNTFCYFISYYLAGAGLKTTDINQYFTNKLDKTIEKTYKTVKKETKNEKEQKQRFYNEVLKLFTSGKIKEYERTVFFHHFPVTQEIKEYFEDKNVRAEIVSLMRNKTDKPGITVLTYDRTETLVFMLTYSEHEEWMALSDINEIDRLRILLY